MQILKLQSEILKFRKFAVDFPDGLFTKKLRNKKNRPNFFYKKASKAKPAFNTKWVMASPFGITRHILLYFKG
jgi:hypothetical protein